MRNASKIFTRMRNETIEGSGKSKKNKTYVQKIYNTKWKIYQSHLTVSKINVKYYI